MHTYFETKNKRDCNGCGACAMRCPKNAIKMQKDEEGFLYPIIDESLCINCGLCRRICSNYPQGNVFQSKVFVAKNREEEKRESSTSGGMFKVIAEEIIKQKGVVFGVTYNEKMQVVHDYAQTNKDLQQFSFSKYVRSDLRDSYQKVEEFLENGRYVLFTGTPCQNYGLRKYLRKDYDKLLLCEIVCYSNPSPEVFKKYLKNLELQNNKKIVKYYFRNKNNEVKRKPYAEFEDGSILVEESFYNAFNNRLISRPSCHKCKFCGLDRKSDFTIGDFWGAKELFQEIIDKNGTSIICINTEKGMQFFEKIKNRMILKETDIHTAFKNNHHVNMKPNKRRTQFFKKFASNEINEKNIISNLQKYSQFSLGEKVSNKIKRMLNIR